MRTQARQRIGCRTVMIASLVICFGWTGANGQAQLAPTQGDVMPKPPVDQTPQFPPGASGNFSSGQSGGVNNQIYINQALPPGLIVTGKTDWVQNPDGFQKDIYFKIQSPGDVTSVEVTVYGKDLTMILFYYDRNASSRTTGTQQSGPDWLSLSGSPSAAIRGIQIRAKTPGEIRFESTLH
jgi:hypothetical protein